MHELDNIQLRSEEVQEILGQIPSRILRYGITVIISVVLIILVASFFFTYPDILTADVEVVSANPPASIVANATGNLTHIYVADSQLVCMGQSLAVIKNPANTKQIEWLSKQIDKHKTLDTATIYIIAQWPDTLVLGDVQSLYASFLNAAKEYKQFVQLDYYQRKIASLQAQKVELRKYWENMKRQAALKEQDFALTKKQYHRDSLLYLQDVISQVELEQSKQSLLQSKLSEESAQSVVTNTFIQIQDLEQQIQDLRIEEINQRQDYSSTLRELRINLKNQLNTWYDTYMLVSPMDGVVAFNSIWGNNQFVQSGEQVFVIVPEKRSQLIGRISLASEGAGKVAPGQQVNVKFSNFPYQEFGMVSARVSSISLVPTEQNYVVEINMPDSLITNYGYVLPFTQNMPGTGEIITEDLPLIVRLFNPLKAIFKQHVRNQRG